MHPETKEQIPAALPKAPEGKEWKQYVGKEIMGDGRFIHISSLGIIEKNEPINAVKGMLACFLSGCNSAWHLVDTAPVRKVSPKPAHHIVPEGYVYLGKRGEFKVPATTFAGYHVRGDDVLNEKTHASGWNGKGSGYYYAPIDSVIARLNGLGPKIEKPTLPFGVPPLPKGYVYLGKGHTFKKDKDFVGAYWESGRADWKKDTGFEGCVSSFHYAAPADSDIAKLNGLGPKAKKTTLRDENARLTKEVAALKEELAKAKADIDYRISRERDTRELATKIISRLS